MTLLLRVLGRLGLRWVVFGAVARLLARRLGRSSIERAGKDLEAKAKERLPKPMAKAVSALPPEALNAGGSVVVAGRAAKATFITTRRAGQIATSGSRRVGASADSARAMLDQVRTETEAARRRMWFRYVEATAGPDAATDSMLDVREQGLPGSAAELYRDAGDPHAGVPDPVAGGRPRPKRRIRSPINRVQRSYRPARKAWD